MLSNATGSRLPRPQGVLDSRIPRELLPWGPSASKARLCLWWGLRRGWRSGLAALGELRKCGCACLLLGHVLPRGGPCCRGVGGGSIAQLTA